MRQVAAGDFLAGAMMALLPGIDANDEHKALAVFRFYTVVLSSLPIIEVTLSFCKPSKLHCLARFVAEVSATHA
jgi:hypothetical protein